ncbi:MAG TPA: histidine kinase dimerization/phospho-acceptor domain-containing protein, partial [Chloroflexia bacterium]|nr:histidine kinase dimerization/phospho-acceptor domain-containing protein [Chloroflexia bacterium]
MARSLPQQRPSRRQALTFQTALLFLVSMLPVVLAVGWANYAYARGTLEQQVGLEVTARTYDTERSLANVVLREFDRLKGLARVIPLSHVDGPAPGNRGAAQRAYEQATPGDAIRLAYVDNPAGRVLKAYREEYTHRAIVLLSDPQGGLESVTSPGWPIWELSGQPWWPDPAAGAGARGLARVADLPGFGLLLFLAVPVLDADGQRVGVVVSGLKLANLAEQILSEHQQDQTTTLIADGAGQVIYALPAWTGGPLPPGWQRTWTALAPGAATLDSYLIAYAPIQGTVSTGLDDGASIRALNRLSWTILLLTPQAVAYAGLQPQFGLLAAGTLVTGGLVVLIALAVVRWRVTRPLSQLAGAIAEVRRHGLSPEVTAQVARRLPQDANEIGALAAVFHQMLEELAALTGQREEFFRQQAAASAREIAAHEQMEAALQRARETLEQRTAELEVANKELEAFSYSVSHDLRAPLRTIDGFSQMFLEDYGTTIDPVGHAYLQRVRAAAGRMAELIDDLLLLARVTRSEMRRLPVNLSAQAQAIAATLQAGAPARAVTFRIAPAIVAHADPRLLRVALENLLGNAWKFTGQHPTATIEFGTLAPADEVVYFVRDDGAG